MDGAGWRWVHGLATPEENICEEFSSVHVLTLTLIRKIFILQTFSSQPIIIFCYGAEVCSLLVNVIVHVNALIGYIQM